MLGDPKGTLGRYDTPPGSRAGRMTELAARRPAGGGASPPPRGGVCEIYIRPYPPHLLIVPGCRSPSAVLSVCVHVVSAHCHEARPT